MNRFELLTAKVDIDDTFKFEGQDIVASSSLSVIEDLPLRASILVHSMNVMVGASIVDLEDDEQREFVEIIKKGFIGTVTEQALGVTIQNQESGTDTTPQDNQES